MSDDLTTSAPLPDFLSETPAAEPAGGAGGKRKGFFKSTLGRIVLAGIALVVLGALIAVAASLVLGLFGANVVKNAIDQTVGGTQQSSSIGTGALAATGTAGSGSATRTAAAKAKEATKVPVAVANSEIFTFRDIFEPLAKDTVVNPSEATSSTFNGEQDTLYLLDIVTENGARHAVLWWNGTQYSLGAAEVIQSTPWQVVEVGEDYAVLLYGDSMVTLRVGQGSIAAK